MSEEVPAKEETKGGEEERRQGEEDKRKEEWREEEGRGGKKKGGEKKGEEERRCEERRGKERREERKGKESREEEERGEKKGGEERRGEERRKEERRRGEERREEKGGEERREERKGKERREEEKRGGRRVNVATFPSSLVLKPNSGLFYTVKPPSLASSSSVASFPLLLLCRFLPSLTSSSVASFPLLLLLCCFLLFPPLSFPSPVSSELWDQGEGIEEREMGRSLLLFLLVFLVHVIIRIRINKCFSIYNSFFFRRRGSVRSAAGKIRFGNRFSEAREEVREERRRSEDPKSWRRRERKTKIRVPLS
ncbi:hypothetical protein NL108_017880 [Boleophthalmus pectinirostris]|nr:hypothetical protein NL108_017880 [Boleophthalmus pectinirostris]